jgi:hypothetical protein
MHVTTVRLLHLSIVLRLDGRFWSALQYEVMTVE